MRLALRKKPFLVGVFVLKRGRNPRGRKPDMEPFAAFLAVILYVHGGLLECMAPILPEMGSQFSRC